MTDKKPIMIDGTTSSGSYRVFARKGNAVLGIKFYGFADGEAFDHPSATMVNTRLRSTDIKNAPGAFQDGDIVKFADKQAFSDWSSAFPAIKFEKNNSEYASTSASVFVHGGFKEHEKLMAELVTPMLYEDMAASLAMLAGEENLIISVDDLKAICRDMVAEGMKHLQLKEDLKAAQIAAVEKSFGVFDITSVTFATVSEKVKAFKASQGIVEDENGPVKKYGNKPKPKLTTGGGGDVISKIVASGVIGNGTVTPSSSPSASLLSAPMDLTNQPDEKVVQLKPATPSALNTSVQESQLNDKIEDEVEDADEEDGEEV